MSVRVGVRVLLVVISLAFARAAFAEDTQQAKRLYTDGMKHYNLADYAPALDEFKRAYFAKPDPAFLFNIAQCQRALSDYEAAAKSYRAFLRESKGLPAATRDEVQRLMSEMDKAINEARAKQPPTGTREPSDEGKNQPIPTPTPTPAPVPVPVPVPIVEPPPAPAPVVAEVSRPKWYRNVAGWSLLGGGVAVAVAGGALLGVSGGVDDDARGATTLQRQSDLHDQAVTYRGTGYALVGVGAAALVAGIVVFAIPAARAKKSATALRVGPWGLGMMVGGSL